MNQIIIIGRLTKAPEVKQTPTGVSVATFTVAVPRRRDREKTDFINVVAWRGLADNCGRYLDKGRKVAVMGELQIRSYEDKDGVRRYVTEINAGDVEFLESRSNASEGNSYSPGDKLPEIGLEGAIDDFEQDWVNEVDEMPF